MAKEHKKRDKKKNSDKAASHPGGPASPLSSPVPGEAAAGGVGSVEGAASLPPKLTRKAYEAEMRILQGELVAM